MFRIFPPSDRYLMRELDRAHLRLPAHAPFSPPSSVTSPREVAVVGNGRLGNALTARLRDAGVRVTGPLGRGVAFPRADAILLCVPDAEIARAAAAVAVEAPVGHCSGATGLEVLGERPAFSLHPLMTVAGDRAGAGANDFVGAGAAVDGTTSHTLALAAELARLLGMRPIRVAAADRAAYHAAASIASNFLVTLQAAAEQLAATAGVRHEDLVPLVRATVENWDRLGADGALTGPVARGDEATVALQRDAVATRTPSLLCLFDELTAATRTLAGRDAAAPAGGPRRGER